MQFLDHYGTIWKATENHTHKSYGTAPNAFDGQVGRSFGDSCDKYSADEENYGHDVLFDTDEEKYGSKPHNISKQVESLQKAYYRRWISYLERIQMNLIQNYLTIREKYVCKMLICLYGYTLYR